MSKYDKQFKDIAEQEEKMLSELYERKLKHLDDELTVRMTLPYDNGFRRIDPEWEYENTPEYIAHQKNNLEIAVMEEKIKIMCALNTIERKKLERLEIEEMRNK